MPDILTISDKPNKKPGAPRKKTKSKVHSFSTDDLLADEANESGAKPKVCALPEHLLQ